MLFNHTQELNIVFLVSREADFICFLVKNIVFICEGFWGFGVLGFWFLVFGFWFLVFWFLVFGFWFLVFVLFFFVCWFKSAGFSRLVLVAWF